LKAGTTLQESHLTYKRPASGISPIFWDRVIGMKLTKNLEEDHVLQWEDVQEATSRQKVVAIVQARMGSERFPGKMMAPLAGRPLLEWILQRVKKARSVSEVVLVTSTDSANDSLESIASDLGVRTIRG